ncbi:aldehyde dehydrogenase domain-containing protein [Diplogelasinospora grovesii]|uniref:Aldehyde dehydrogenase domain-containing protein n=1 Tax=Diplogelasinospora grovesii TaxID=303347 RepID=A0AAN6NA97_9PEZI|nr:aldehyde dehydrogenase domain-containing protein [Diplogelasinospora grovesii]
MAETAKEVVSAIVNGETSYSVPFFINGEEVHPEKKFDIISPDTGKVVHRCGSATSAEAAAAVEAAAKAFKTWKKSLPKTRRDVFLKAAELFEKRKAELAQYMMDETGCAQVWADFNVNLAKDMLVDVAGRISSLEGTIPVAADPNVGALILKEPYGVVLAIAPWNAPYILAMRSVLFPMAAGNTAILKGSELCPKTMWGVVSVFHEAGIPAGVLNLIVHEPANAAAITSQLIAHPDVKKINFTGSTAVGRIIGRLAGEQLKPVLLELGGKAPAIVWEDADLDNAAMQCALGAFFNSGQICMSTERIIIHKNVRVAFEEKLAAVTEKIFSSPAVLISGMAVEKNKKLLQDALSKGASLLYGDVNAEETTKTRMKPVIVSGVKEEMDIYKTESFGPSVSLFEVETEEEALRIANDTDYGLTSAVFTEDLRRGLRFAKEIETGAVHINNMTVHDESALPHGGAKASGYGRFNAAGGLGEWVRTKTITYKL